MSLLFAKVLHSFYALTRRHQYTYAHAYICAWMPTHVMSAAGALWAVRCVCGGRYSPHVRIRFYAFYRYLLVCLSRLLRPCVCVCGAYALLQTMPVSDLVLHMRNTHFFCQLKFYNCDLSTFTATCTYLCSYLCGTLWTDFKLP